MNGSGNLEAELVLMTRATPHLHANPMFGPAVALANHFLPLP